MLRINKTRFYVGEKVVIEGRITPPPENKNVQLVRYYYCNGEWWRASDVWGKCDDKGFFKIEYKAEVASPLYCGVGRGGTQKWRVTVRYQPYRGQPPVPLGSLEYEVVNKGVPVAKITNVIGWFKGRRAVVYPPYGVFGAEYGGVFKLNVTVENSGAEMGRLWCRIVDEESGEEVGPAQVSMEPVRPGDLATFSFDIEMPRRDLWRLSVEAGHIEDSRYVKDDAKTVTVKGYMPKEPKAKIVDIVYPEEAEPGEDVVVEARVRNTGAAGVIFADIVDLDTGETLASKTMEFSSGEVDTFKLTFKMPNKTLRARLRVGHYVGGPPRPV